MSEQPPPEPPAVPAAPADEPQQAKIDIERLAEKVYRLMLAELRLEQARAAPVTRQRSDL